MKAIYLDNFRGFCDTIIPLEQVNFLVGENSTGKSSVLSLIEIISHPTFPLTFGAFPINSDKLGGFEDIVSAESKDKTNFTIGYVLPLYKNKKKKKNEQNFFLIISYKQETDEIRPFKLTYSDTNRIIIIDLSKDGKIQYKVEIIEKNNILTVFKSAISFHHSSKEGFKDIAETQKRNIPINTLPLFVLQTFISRDLNEKENNERERGWNPFDYRFDVISIAPMREKPKRIYENIKSGFSPEGSHTPQLLNDILNNNSKLSSELKQALKDFGEESGLFNEVVSKRYGETNSAPFEINITLLNEPIKLPYVGYGVAQVLPIIVESIIREENNIFCIQQPEVHLHPKAQAALGKFFFTLSNKENKNFLIETHSDFLIDRFRYTSSKQDSLKKPSSQVIYFERKGSNNVATCIQIDKHGRYSEEQPDSFRDFFLKEQLALLEI
ncbi:TPA: AAA family ATPase [Legionella pneumophila]|uniref:AAA family ATPase n=1 Tax=Legionella pneumophila TaxID=446 RepID=UPI000777F059|nr:AAA family ATPase [Legionella pneumophila]HCJ1046412.1 AAA family ATPase [Legionella pneumophila]HDS3848404.1 AAA family ATPase [Legionella pneumophila]